MPRRFRAAPVPVADEQQPEIRRYLLEKLRAKRDAWRGDLRMAVAADAAGLPAPSLEEMRERMPFPQMDLLAALEAGEAAVVTAYQLGPHRPPGRRGRLFRVDPDGSLTEVPRPEAES